MSGLPTLSCATVREIDRRAMREFGVPGLILMENAGRGVAEELIRRQPRGPITICCGTGNNGGDGWVIARHLDLHGFDVRLVFCGSTTAPLPDDARTNYEIACRSGLAICRWPSEREATADQQKTAEQQKNAGQQTTVEQAGSSAVGDSSASLAVAQQWLAESAWIVDALLGTGSRGNPRSPLDHVIRAINDSPAQVLAVDLPSGLDGDSGSVGEPTVRADVTCTFVAAKPGLVALAAQPYVGQLIVVDIGAPGRLIREYLPH